ncbi:hypothetical protein QQZ08_005107 [Neonectria magnoliae]|uniref:Uncharacterized protein n=1 Tax=Neonectria magnoliae TaxID=2732573 RepID=A0ABR1I4F7_9HYPO
MHPQTSITPSAHLDRCYSCKRFQYLLDYVKILDARAEIRFRNRPARLRLEVAKVNRLRFRILQRETIRSHREALGLPPGPDIINELPYVGDEEDQGMVDDRWEDQDQDRDQDGDEDGDDDDDDDDAEDDDDADADADKGEDVEGEDVVENKNEVKHEDKDKDGKDRA